MMSKKVTVKTPKPKASKTPRSKSTKQAGKRERATGSPSAKNARDGHIVRSSATGRFVATKTGRVIKSSPAKPRLGKKLIHDIVWNWVHVGTVKIPD